MAESLVSQLQAIDQLFLNGTISTEDAAAAVKALTSAVAKAAPRTRSTATTFKVGDKPRLNKVTGKMDKSPSGVIVIAIDGYTFKPTNLYPRPLLSLLKAGQQGCQFIIDNADTMAGYNERFAAEKAEVVAEATAMVADYVAFAAWKAARQAERKAA